jgi:hypothetical protein
LDDAQARLKEMFRAQVPINSDCTFLSLTVGCSELADHALASAFKNYNLSDTAPACKEDLTNTLSPIFHACHLDRENAIVIKHLNELDRIAREDKTKDTTTKRKTDLQAYGLRASLPDLQRALGTTQYWAYCIMTDFVTDPNKPVIDRIATTYLGILRDEMGASFIKRMTQIYPHCVTQIMSILQSYQSMIQSFVNCVPEDFDELTIDPAIFQAPLEGAMHAARDLSLAITAKQPPPTLSNDTDRIPPIYMDLYPPAKRAIEHPQGPNQRLRSDPSSTRGTGILRSPSITNNTNNNNNNSGGRTDGSDKSQSTGLRIAPIDADNPPGSYFCRALDEAVADEKLLCINFLRGGCSFGQSCYRFHANTMADLPQSFLDRLQAHLNTQGYHLVAKSPSSPTAGGRGGGRSGGRGGRGGGRGGGRNSGGTPPPSSSTNNAANS